MMEHLTQEDLTKLRDDLIKTGESARLLGICFSTNQISEKLVEMGYPCYYLASAAEKCKAIYDLATMITIRADRLNKMLAGYDPIPKQQMINWLKGGELKDSAIVPDESPLTDEARLEIEG